MNTKKE